MSQLSEQVSYILKVYKACHGFSYKYYNTVQKPHDNWTLFGRSRHSLKNSDSDELDKGGSGSESEVAETTESSSDDGVAVEEINEKTKKLKRAEETIKHLDASIAAQEATNQKRLAELAQTRNNYQSEVEVTELYFRNVVSEIQFHYSLRTMY